MRLTYGMPCEQAPHAVAQEADALQVWVLSDYLFNLGS
jgi:hypothetical protein